MSSLSKLETDLEVDDPLVQDAGYEFDESDRQYIDNQIRALGKHLVAALIRGRHATYMRLDGASVAVIPGDIVCSASFAGAVDPTVTKAVAAALAIAKAALGVVVIGAAPGGWVLVAMGGLLPPIITGLAATSGYARVNTTTARLERVAALIGTDFPMGTIDAQGWLAVGRQPTNIGASIPIDVTNASVVALPGADTQLLYRDGNVIGATPDVTYEKGTGTTRFSALGDAVMSVAANAVSFLKGAINIASPWTIVYNFPAGNLSVVPSSGGGNRTLTLPFVTATLLHSGQLAAASGIASLNASSKVVQDPASAGLANGVATLDASQKLVQAVPNRIVSVNTVALTANVATTSTAMVDVTGLSVTLANCQVGDLLVFDASVGYTTSVNAGAQYEVVGVDGGSTVQNGSFRSFFAGSGTAYNSAMSGVHVVATAGSVTIKVRHSISTTGTLTTSGASTGAGSKSSLRVLQIRP